MPLHVPKSSTMINIYIIEQITKSSGYQRMKFDFVKNRVLYIYIYIECSGLNVIVKLGNTSDMKNILNEKIRFAQYSDDSEKYWWFYYFYNNNGYLDLPRIETYIRATDLRTLIYTQYSKAVSVTCIPCRTDAGKIVRECKPKVWRALLNVNKNKNDLTRSQFSSRTRIVKTYSK